MSSSKNRSSPDPSPLVHDKDLVGQYEGTELQGEAERNVELQGEAERNVELEAEARRHVELEAEARRHVELEAEARRHVYEIDGVQSNQFRTLD